MVFFIIRDAWCDLNKYLCNSSFQNEAKKPLKCLPSIMASQHSSKRSQTLNLTVKAEPRTQKQGTVKSEAKHNESNDNSTSRREQKLITSFRRFKILPNDEEWFLASIRVLGSDKFRLALVNKDICYMSQECDYDKIRNESYSTTNSEQFRTHFISATTNPNDEDYEIEAEDQWGKNKESNKSEYPRRKILKIVRKAGNLRIVIAKVGVHLNKRSDVGKNMTYLLGKMVDTLFAKQQQNERLLRDNNKFQIKYNKSLQFIDEAMSAKNNQEQELLSKFVLILNEKKKKIRALQQEIFRLKQNGNIVQSSSISNSISPVIVANEKNNNNENKNRNKRNKPSVIINDDKQNKKDNDGDVIIIENIDDENKNKNKNKNRNKSKKKEIERLDTNDIIAQINEQQNNAKNKKRNSNNRNSNNSNSNSEDLEFDLSISDINMDMSQSEINDVNSLSFPINSESNNKNRKKRKRDVLNEKDDPPNKRQKVTQKKANKDNNKKRRISNSSDTSTTSDDFNTNSII